MARPMHSDGVAAVIARFIRTFAARQLGRRSHVNHVSQRDRIIARTKQMRVELGLGEDWRLA